MPVIMYSQNMNTGGPQLVRIHYSEIDFLVLKYVFYLIVLVQFLAIVKFLAHTLVEIQIVWFRIAQYIFGHKCIAIRGPTLVPIC